MSQPIDLLPSAALVGEVVGHPMTVSSPPAPMRPEERESSGAAESNFDPAECEGLATPVASPTYAGPTVRAAVIEEFDRGSSTEPGTRSVTVAVIEFDSEAAARASFVTQAGQWEACAGKEIRSEITPRGLVIPYQRRVTEVDADDPGVAAKLLFSNGMDKRFYPATRAIVMRSRYVIDVAADDSSRYARYELDDPFADDALTEQFAGPDSAASDIARRVADGIPAGS